MLRKINGPRIETGKLSVLFPCRIPLLVHHLQSARDWRGIRGRSAGDGGVVLILEERHWYRLVGPVS